MTGVCLINLEVWPSQTVADRWRRRGAEGAIKYLRLVAARPGVADYFSQVLSRRAASAMSSVEPAKENRTKRRPSDSSKSMPGVAATPVSCSIRWQNAGESLVRWPTSA